MKKETRNQGQGISRRDFLKGTAVGAASLAAMGILGACAGDTAATTAAGEATTAATEAATAAATEAATAAATTAAATEAATEATAAAASYTPGTYTAKAYGNISYITVETTFSETEITGIKVLEHNETPVLFSQVEEQFIPALVENQAGGVDVVAGASNSSRAIREAVADCIAQAGGDAEGWLAKKVEKTASADESYEADLVIVGVGAAGFMAANVAAKKGLKVIAVEKGGSVAAVNGIKVSGPFAVETEVLKNKEGGSTLVVDDAFYHVMEYTHWTPNPLLMRRCLEESKNAVAELQEIGYEFQEVNFRFETPFIGEKGGFHLILNPVEDRVKLWEQALEKNGVEVFYNTSATSLLQDGETVNGITAEKADGTKVTIKAGAVILSSGGYLGNRDMQERFLGTRHLNAASGGDSLCTGDAINMATAIGAGLDKTFGYCPCEYGGTNQKASRPAKQDKYDQNTAFKFGLYGCLLVDAAGNRFINEGLLCDYPMSYGSEQILRNAPWYAVVDQAYVDAMTTQGLYEYTTAKGATAENWFIGNYFKERILTNLPADIEEGLKEGWLYKADTIEELGKFFGLTNLAATVEQYNGYCEKGVDEQYGTNPWYLSPVAQGPFYVVQNEPSAWSTFGGVRIDENCRALNCENQVIPGLYVCGTDAGSLYYSPYYDIPGYCYGLCIDSGLIAAEEAAAYVKG
ncbi:MAG: FAD-binding protein [Lachnospiraceae bacterium]|nr:FAD-binding protein [Lachnospiraceae bacterium]